MKLQREQMLAAISTVRRANNGKLLIVGYGSLPNKPEPGMVHLAPVFIWGYRKELCVRVMTCRGSFKHPGLVAGLVPKARSSAMAMLSEVATQNCVSFLERIEKRELDGKAYSAQVVGTTDLLGHFKVALCFVAEIYHPDFWQGDHAAAVSMILQAGGACGANVEYVRSLLDFESSVFGACTPSIDAISHAIALVSTKNLDPANQTTGPEYHRKSTATCRVAS